MHRRNCSLVVALAFALLLSAHAVASAAVPGLAPLRVRGATALGPVHPGSMSVTIALSPRHRAGLAALVRAERAGRARPIGARAYDVRFGPSARTVSAVRAWARANGLHVASISKDRQLVTLAGPARAFERAFRVRFERFRTPGGRTFSGPAGTAKLPRSFRSHALAVVGLSSLERVSLAALPRIDRPNPARLAASPGLNFPSQYGPKDLWSLYNAPAETTASGASGFGQSVAVIAEGDVSGPQADLAKFESTFGLPTVTWNTIKVSGASSDASGDDEWDLDTQYSTGFAPHVSSVNVYDGPSLSDSDILNTITRWVTDDSVSQASFSAGECEALAQASGFMTSLDSELQHAQAQGQSLFVSSGDTGSFCPAIVGVNGVPAGLPFASYPASSPYAIGVGGTTVLGPGPNEIAWYAGGGGSSVFEPTPSWQMSAGGSFVGAKRGVPDVALDADPNSGYEVIVAGQEQVIGGTSASAPSWQGIWARAQASHGGALGFAGPVLYATVPRSAYNDVTLGGNGLYPATPGWDYDTGLGTPDINAFVGGA